MSGDVSIVDGAQAQLIDVNTASYGDLTSGATSFFTVESVGLTDKSLLLGVPHVITKLTWQAVPPAQKGKERVRGFVSVEATIGDERALTRAVARSWVPNVNNIEQLMFDPNERIIYNDGSTGIRRQLVWLLHSIGVVRVADDIENERDRRLDTPWDEWVSAGEQWREMSENADGEMVKVPCITHDHQGNPFLLHSRRGLYVSQYDNDYGEAETYYLK